MSSYILTTRASILCPHGGTVTMTPTATRVAVDGDPPLRMGDIGTIAGCPFTIGNTPSPCVRTEWMMPANQVTVAGAAVLTHTSVCLCISAANAPQGTAQISNFQTRVTAR
jgi:hypothetical protein